MNLTVFPDLLGIVLLLMLAVGLGWWIAGGRRRTEQQPLPQPEENTELAALRGQLEQVTQATKSLQETVTNRFQDQERHMTETLRQQTEETGKRLGQLQERLALIDRAQESLSQLSAQTTRLENVLANKQARGAFGEVQLENLVRQALPPDAWQFQHTLSNGKRADCLLVLPHPPGPIVIDAKFPLEAWYQLGDAEDESGRITARKALTQAMAKHVADIAERYIIDGETANSAILFLPSEAIYAEFHTNLTAAVENSYASRVYITSPTTLMATLNTVRAVLRDVKMQEQAALIQKQVGELMKDVRLLAERVGKLDRHFTLAQKDIEQISTSTRRITNRGGRIERIELEDKNPTLELTEPAALEAGGQAENSED